MNYSKRVGEALSGTFLSLESFEPLEIFFTAGTFLFSSPSPPPPRPPLLLLFFIISYIRAKRW